jgi:hypothetical protein
MGWKIDVEKVLQLFFVSYQINKIIDVVLASSSLSYEAEEAETNRTHIVAFATFLEKPTLKALFVIPELLIYVHTCT